MHKKEGQSYSIDYNIQSTNQTKQKQLEEQQEEYLLELALFLLQHKVAEVKVLYPVINIPSEYTSIKDLRRSVFDYNIRLNREAFSANDLTIEKYIELVKSSSNNSIEHQLFEKLYPFMLVSSVTSSCSIDDILILASNFVLDWGLSEMNDYGYDLTIQECSNKVEMIHIIQMINKY